MIVLFSLSGSQANLSLFSCQRPRMEQLQGREPWVGTSCVFFFVIFLSLPGLLWGSVCLGEVSSSFHSFLEKSLLIPSIWASPAVLAATVRRVVRFNGQEGDFSEYKTVMGFVPQDAPVHRGERAPPKALPNGSRGQKAKVSKPWNPPSNVLRKHTDQFFVCQEDVVHEGLTVGAPCGEGWFLLTPVGLWSFDAL